MEYIVSYRQKGAAGSAWFVGGRYTDFATAEGMANVLINRDDVTSTRIQPVKVGSWKGF